MRNREKRIIRLLGLPLSGLKCRPNQRYSPQFVELIRRIAEVSTKEHAVYAFNNTEYPDHQFHTISSMFIFPTSEWFDISYKVGRIP